MNQPLPSRRIVFHGLSALGVAAVLAGCGGAEVRDPAADKSPADGPPPQPSDSPSDKLQKPDKQQPNALATTAEIPVGGGMVLTDERIVITQPTSGEFKAFSAVCTHQGQTVGEVADNTITCTYHGSQYDAANGDVVAGPATAGLDPVQIRVKGEAILRA
jgi:Rieske Fe-S protein